MPSALLDMLRPSAVTQVLPDHETVIQLAISAAMRSEVMIDAPGAMSRNNTGDRKPSP